MENTETSEVQLNQIHCESKDEESDTENTQIINLLQIEPEFETRTESNYCQKEFLKPNFPEIDKNQETKITFHI